MAQGGVGLLLGSCSKERSIKPAFMKHLLLITFYFPPYTGIEGNRPNSWVKSFVEAGYKVTVLTRQWQVGGQNTWADYVAEYGEDKTVEEKVSEQLKVIRLPHKWTDSYRNLQFSKLSGLYYWYCKLRGRFHVETEAYHSFYDYAFKILNSEKIDLIIVSSPPLNLIRLAHDLSNQSGVPYIADFRDSYNNYKLNPAYQPSWKQRGESVLFKFYLKKWLAGATAIVTVDKAVSDTINTKFKQPVLVVRNGYETDLFDGIEIAADDAAFRLTVTGNLYANQDIPLVAKGIGEFIKKVQPVGFKAHFIGLKDRLDVVETLRRYIPVDFLFLTPRLPRVEALRAMRRSQVLLQVGWPGYKGIMPGKVYEYMAAGRNIIIAPGDKDITDKIIAETQTGVSVHSAAEMTSYLIEKYGEWRQKGSLDYKGDRKVIAAYSREAQNATLVSFVDGLLNSAQRAFNTN